MVILIVIVLIIVLDIVTDFTWKGKYELDDNGSDCGIGQDEFD